MLLLTLEEERLAEGKAIAQREEKFDTARRMRQMGMNDSDIHKVTELSLEEIKSI